MSCCSGDDEEEQRRGPTHIRRCTDVFWLILFISFWSLMILIAAFAFVYGSPTRLIHGYDSFGNTCGTKNPKFGNMELSGQDTSDKPYLFFMDVGNVTNSLKICVKKCPNRKLNSMNDVCEFYRETGSQLCLDAPGSNFSACNSSDNKKKTGSCPEFPVFDSIPVLNRCVPVALQETTKFIISNIYGVLNSWDLLEQISGDLYLTWKQILSFSFLAFALSLLMIAIFHLLASVVSWVIMVLVSISSIGGTALLWWTYFQIKEKLDNTEDFQLLDETERNVNVFFGLSVVATVITLVLLCLLIALRKHIGFMTALFKESAKCLIELPGLFFTPLMTFLALITLFAFWASVMLSLASAKYPETRSVQKYGNRIFESLNLNVSALEGTNSSLERKVFDWNNYKSFTLVEYVEDTWVKYMWWVYVIGLIWTAEFISACQNMVVAGAVAHWYFRGKDASRSPVCSSLGTLFCYHLGSVACGSFLITLFKVPRLILTWLHQKFDKTKETSACAQCGLKCCICCFYCLEKFIRFMNHNAYTVVAIEGTNFCKSARVAFATIVSNAIQIAVINSVGDFILFLGKCFVTAATGSVGLLFLKQDPRLHFYATPVIVTCIFAFFIAHCVISLYETIIDTLFLCICEDKNLNGENGKWRESGLAQLGQSTNTNGQQSHELAPMNQ